MCFECTRKHFDLVGATYIINIIIIIIGRPPYYYYYRKLKNSSGDAEGIHCRGDAEINYCAYGKGKRDTEVWEMVNEER